MMYYKKSQLSLLLALIMITACNCTGLQSANHAEDTQPNEATINKQTVFDKLLGIWQNEDGKSFEQWTKIGDSTYQSNVFTITNNDTSWNERADIYRDEGKWVFENTVKSQNEGKSVKFSSLTLDENKVQFSNPAHDFPTDVNYTVIDDSTVHAFIIGPNNKGGKDTIPFNYKRIH